jgi:hypothetical protein
MSTESRAERPGPRPRSAGRGRAITVRAIALGVVANLALAAVVAGSQAGPGYVAVDSWTADAVSARTVRVSATTAGAIPRQADDFIAGNVIVGLAWADLDTGTALVATIHPALGRDSHQRPAGWHLHTVQLAGGATAPNDFCLVAVLSTPTGGIRIQGSTMTVDLAAAAMPAAGGSSISVDDLDAAVGFTVHSGDAGCETSLGVRVRT